MADSNFLRDLGKKLGFLKDEERKGRKEAVGPEEKPYKCATCGSESQGVVGTCCGMERQGV